MIFPFVFVSSFMYAKKQKRLYKKEEIIIVEIILLKERNSITLSIYILFCRYAMGRNNHMTVKQYGRHRQRVILADNWSGSDSREDLFSCSANSSQECMSSDTSSYIPTRNRNKQLSTLAHRNSKYYFQFTLC